MKTQITLESIHGEIQALKSLFLNTKAQTKTDEYLTPLEVCNILKISRNKFESMKQNGFLKTYKPDPDGRKVYCLLSEIQQLFPKDLN